MAVLVTGATGQVGRHVVDQLAKAGERVRAMTRAPEKARPHPAAEVVRGDLDEPESLTNLFQDVDRMYLFPCPGTARESSTSRSDPACDASWCCRPGPSQPGTTPTTSTLSSRPWRRRAGVDTPAARRVHELHVWGPSIRALRDRRRPHSDMYTTSATDLSGPMTSGLGHF